MSAENNDNGVKRQLLSTEVAEEDEQDEELQRRLSQFPANAICKGEDFLTLKFASTSGNNSTYEQAAIQVAKPGFTHQLFPDSYHCGLVELGLELVLDATTWNVVDARETFKEQTENSEGSALELLKSKDCISPLFATGTEEFSILPGEEIWQREDGYALKWCEKLDDTGKMLLSRGLAVSTFFIERASQVDLQDPAWKLLLLVKRPSNAEPRTAKELLIGFTSVYEFKNPIKDTRSLRVCVMLVLPMYQRQKFGDLMLSTVYREASSHRDICEVTVEDPCEAFARMRHKVELNSCKRRGFFFNWELQGFEQMGWKLSKEMVAKLQPELRFTEKELRFCFECAWLSKINELGVVAEETEAKTRFRKTIKERISKDPGDVILPDKKSYPEEYKLVLQEEYLKELSEMERTLAAVIQTQLDENEAQTSSRY